MAARLVIGRAGTGKTALCVREIRAEMRRDPLGPPLLWLVPEQGTFAAERLLLMGETGEAGAGGGAARGMFRAQVLSFRRLAMLIARETGILQGTADGGLGKPLDDVARLVLLEEMVRRHKGRLTVFAGVAERPGFVQRLDATLRELRQHGHSGATLRGLVEESGTRMEAVMQRKLLDLAVLLEGWSEVVEKSGAWDFEQLMHRAALAMGSAPLVAGKGGAGKAQVWVDAMSAMSALEVRMLAGLGQHAAGVTITLLADPDSPGMQAMREAADGGGLFARTERLHRRMVDAFRRHDVEMGTTVALRTGHRFADPMVRRVEAELLEEGRAAVAPALVSAPVMERKVEAKNVIRAAGDVPRGRKKKAMDRGPTLFEALEAEVAGGRNLGSRSVGGARAVVEEAAEEGSGVEVWEASDPETEVRAAAQAIRALAAGSDGATGMRYRQIAVIVPELDEAGANYQDAIRRIFGEHQIPHFIDARRGVAHHPLVELVRSAVGLVTSHFERDEMLLYLKTQLAGVAAGDVALLENYVIEHGVTHVPWDQAWTWIVPNRREDEADERIPASAYERLARVNEIRARVWQTAGGLAQRLSAGGQTGRDGAGDYAGALRKMLAELGVEEQLKAWSARQREMGGPAAELAQVHEQVWREVQRLLDLLSGILAEHPRTLEEFEPLLGAALERLTLGLIPPTVDQVLVSSVTRSRVPEMEVVIILGAVEGQFPKVVAEDPILSDAQREVFNAVAADPIGEGSDRQLLEMPFFDYVALTRARRRLVVSYPAADRQGKAQGSSRHVRRLEELFGARLVRESFDAQSRMEIERMATVDDLLAGVTGWAREVYARAAGEVLGGREHAFGARARANGVGDSMGLAPEAEALTGVKSMAPVYNWVVTGAPAEIEAARRRIWSCVGPRRVPGLSEKVAAGFFPKGAALRMSISRLEQFAACPLQFFAQDTLGLKQRAEFQLDQLSLGELQHRILEQVYRRLMEGELDWPYCTREQVGALLVEEVDAAIQEKHAEIAQRTPGYDKMRLRVIRLLGIVLEGDRRRAGQGEMRPRAVELYFGRGKTAEVDAGGRLVSLPVLELRGRDRAIQVSGKIDRMDEPESGEPQAVVIDYKSAARKSMDLDRVLEGISLQLPAYGLVMRQVAGREPVAGLYMPLGLWPETVAHAGEGAEPDDDAFFQKKKLRGLVDAEFAWELDRALLSREGEDEGRDSRWYKLQFKKKGEPRQDSDLLTHQDFHLVLNYVAWMMAMQGSDVAAGRIAPTPYRQGQEIPCARCAYASLCPFDPARDRFREVVKQGKGGVLNKMREKLSAARDQSTA